MVLTIMALDGRGSARKEYLFQVPGYYERVGILLVEVHTGKPVLGGDTLGEYSSVPLIQVLIENVI